MYITIKRTYENKFDIDLNAIVKSILAEGKRFIIVSSKIRLRTDIFIIGDKPVMDVKILVSVME